MRLLCLYCGNYTYFEIDVETLKELSCNREQVLIENVCFEDIDHTEETLRDNLHSQLKYIFSQSNSQLLFDPHTETYYSNIEVICSRCGSRKITIPSKNHKPLTLEQELEQNRDEFNQIRKERDNYEDNLPILWEP